MSPPQLMAVFPVFDVDIARPFYERLLGRPADNHPDSRMIWILNESSYFQVSFDPIRAGSTRLGIVANVLGLDRYSMDTVVAELRRRGVDAQAHADNKHCDITDPDGNHITLRALDASKPLLKPDENEKSQ